MSVFVGLIEPNIFPRRVSIENAIGSFECFRCCKNNSPIVIIFFCCAYCCPNFCAAGDSSYSSSSHASRQSCELHTVNRLQSAAHHACYFRGFLFYAPKLSHCFGRYSSTFCSTFISRCFY